MFQRIEELSKVKKLLLKKMYAYQVELQVLRYESNVLLRIHSVKLPESILSHLHLVVVINLF